MVQRAITSGQIIQMDANSSGLTFRYTEAVLYSTGTGEGIKANVNVQSDTAL